jgi:hypothetical protein
MAKTTCTIASASELLLGHSCLFLLHGIYAYLESLWYLFPRDRGPVTGPVNLVTIEDGLAVHLQNRHVILTKEVIPRLI